MCRAETEVRQTSGVRVRGVGADSRWQKTAKASLELERAQLVSDNQTNADNIDASEGADRRCFRRAGGPFRERGETAGSKLVTK